MEDRGKESKIQRKGGKTGYDKALKEGKRKHGNSLLGQRKGRGNERKGGKLGLVSKV